MGSSLSASASSAIPRDSYSFHACSRSAPFLNVNAVKLEECGEEFDVTKREVKFAFRCTDLGSSNSTTSQGGSHNSSFNPMHWAVVVHFPRDKKTYLFEAWKDDKTGLLQAGRAEGVDYRVFEKATYFGTMETSPSELLTKAKQVSTGQYSILNNNSQTWLREFLDLISPILLPSLYNKIPPTETYPNYIDRISSTVKDEGQKKE